MHKRGIVGYSKKSALLEEAITHMNTGKYGRSSAALKELLALDPQNIEARRLFATLHLRLGSLVTARQAFESLANEAIGRQDYWLAESLLHEYLAAGPRCVPFLEQLAHVHQEKGDEMAAVAELGKAIEILRDDPDTDNPQKAAQLYAKIRELAPASSVALQLAPLFDVQTGEFLAPPPTPPTLDDEAPSDQSLDSQQVSPVHTVLDHPLPDVMPWEITDGVSSVSDSEHDLLTPPEPVEEDAQRSPTTTGEDDPAPLEVWADQTAVHESANEEAPCSLEAIQDAPSESPSNESSGDIGLSQGQPQSAISSPMPWEQLADASVQIVDVETPRASDSSHTLEAVLSTLRSEEEAAAATAGVTEVVVTTTETVHPSEPMQAEDGSSESAPPSAPMPWEQISDPAIQISVADPSPLASEELVPTIPAASGEASSPMPVADAPTMPQPAMSEPKDVSTKVSSSSEPSAAIEAEAPPATSLSWNAAFDKAWKFTGGTLTPSPLLPSDVGHELSEQPPPIETPLAESAVVSPQSVEEEPSLPAAPPTPMLCSTIAEEGALPEVEAATPGQPPAASATIPAPADTSSHWNTGEVAVQVHRPSKKKKRWEKDLQETEQPAVTPSMAEAPSSTSQEPRLEWKSATPDQVPSREEAVSPAAAAVRPDWMQATDVITFARPDALPTQSKWSDVDATLQSTGDYANAAAVSAVDTLFAPSATVDDLHPHLSWSKPRPRFIARLHRVRIGIFSFIGSCFSTTRSLTFLTLLIAIAVVVVAAVGTAALGVMWMAMEDPPSPLYQSLTISPPRLITDARKNGYLLLLGFEAPVGQDALQAGYERKPAQEHDRAAAQVCRGGDEAKLAAGTGGAYDQVVRGWIHSGDPLAAKGQGGILKGLMSRESTALARYQQWLNMSFDDWGFGQSISPNCTHVLLVHRLFVLDGFNQDLSTGLDRLEADVQAWRGALGQSKTLSIKMLAVTAVQDDASIVSGLLSRTDLDGQALTRLSKIVRPLDQTELSVRWPMQSEFVSATRSVQAELKDDKAQDRPWHASMAAAMRLPVQRRANAYAEYYDAANKAVAGGRHMNLPKISTFVRTPPLAVTDYLTNPIEHIVGLEPLPSWDPYVMRMIEADAQLRLAGLQAWLRRGPQDGDVLMRLAKAGQAYYDPFTGLPMLVNQRKGVIYSVGRDGKDQEGDDKRDVTAMIPLSGSDYRRTASASFR
ncbi:MAG TPA: hypothetical protein VJR03_00115 [Nitrospira sp.]|nr:hypothetical protein [Nitrospira sp.]